MELKGNCLVAQSGGPTAVINSSAYGVIKKFYELNDEYKIYAGIYGIQGIMNGKIKDLSCYDRKYFENLLYMPSAAFGSCRYKLKDAKNSEEEYKKIFKVFNKYDIKYFFYIGGNDSMDTAFKLSKYAEENSFDISIIGVPKTIDNDLVVTDHCPGYGSAAKYLVNSAAELWMDINTYDSSSIMVMETMGRDTGWLAASTGLIKKFIPDVNQLIYIPEMVFDEEKFLRDVSQALKANRKLLVVTSEGLKNKNGDYINTDSGLYSRDAFGHKQLGGVGRYLQSCIKNNVDKNVKMTEMGVPQRCAAHLASKTDVYEAISAGEKAVELGIKGEKDCMVYFKRESNSPYKISIEKVALKEVCNKVKHVPINYINEDETGVTKEMIDYVEPLIKGKLEALDNSLLYNYIDFKSI